MQQELAQLFTITTACLRAGGKVVCPSAWQGRRRSQVTQDVNPNVLWWNEEPEGGGAEPLWAGAVVSTEAKAACISLSCPCSAGTHQEIPNKGPGQRSNELPPTSRAAGTIPPAPRLSPAPEAAHPRGWSHSSCRASVRAGDGSSCPGCSTAREGFPQAVCPTRSLRSCRRLHTGTTTPIDPSSSPQSPPQHPLCSQGQGTPGQHLHPLSLLLQYLLLSS